MFERLERIENKKNMEIRNRYTNEIIISNDSCKTIKELIEAYTPLNLEEADLYGADLS